MGPVSPSPVWGVLVIQRTSSSVLKASFRSGCGADRHIAVPERGSFPFVIILLPLPYMTGAPTGLDDHLLPILSPGWASEAGVHTSVSSPGSQRPHEPQGRECQLWPLPEGWPLPANRSEAHPDLLRWGHVPQPRPGRRTTLSLPLCWKLPPSVQWRVQPPVSSLAVSGHQLVVATVGALMTRGSSLNQ